MTSLSLFLPPTLSLYFSCKTDSLREIQREQQQNVEVQPKRSSSLSSPLNLPKGLTSSGQEGKLSTASSSSPSSQSLPIRVPKGGRRNDLISSPSASSSMGHGSCVWAGASPSSSLSAIPLSTPSIHTVTPIPGSPTKFLDICKQQERVAAAQARLKSRPLSAIQIEEQVGIDFGL